MRLKIHKVVLDGISDNMFLLVQYVKYGAINTTDTSKMGYYVIKFFSVVTQGDLISPTIFNVVVDAVVRHWVSVIMEGAEERGERVQESIYQNSSFYTDNGMVALSDL